MTVDRMRQSERNVVTNADVVDDVLMLKRFDGSKVSVNTGGSGLEFYIRLPASQAVQVNTSPAALVGYVPIDSPISSGSGVSYENGLLTFDTAGIYSLSILVQCFAGDDGGQATGGVLAISTSSDLTDPRVALSLNPNNNALYGCLSVRRGFLAGETVEPDLIIVGADESKHANVQSSIWVTS